MKKLFVCALAVAMVFAFTAPTMAADWAFYGQARFATFSSDVSKEASTTAYSDADTTWNMQANARIGATVSGGDVGGGFEYGNSAELAGIRKLYGTWNFGAGTLLIGKTYTPIAEFYSNQVGDGDADLLSYGMAYDSRRDQIALTFGGFQIAFIEPNVSAPINATVAPVVVTNPLLGATGITYTAMAGDTDTSLPKIALAYTFSTDMFSVKPYVGWQSIDFNKGLDNMESVDSLVYGIGGKVNLGPAYIGANFWMGTNAGNYGLAMATEGRAAWDGTNLKDNDAMAYAGVVGFKASDMFTIEGGYGAIESEIDFGGATGKVEDTANSYYVNCTITLAPGVFVVPEFGKLDKDEIKNGATTIKEGDTTYFGAKWQINF